MAMARARPREDLIVESKPTINESHGNRPEIAFCSADGLQAIIV